MSATSSAIKRLKKRREFLYVAKGTKAVRPGVVIQARRRGGDLSCGIGFTATKKVGNAVIRNRAKRRLRETARLLLPLHGQPGFDYVFIARAATPDREWPKLLEDVETALLSLAPSEAVGKAENKPERP
ncbi:MAG: ribonuclease P protein component [Alphaproteobacteria bacterium]|nr:ribonuclease P protein component [Alphaproteobacteria bacterium]